MRKPTNASEKPKVPVYADVEQPILDAARREKHIFFSDRNNGSQEIIMSLVYGLNGVKDQVEANCPPGHVPRIEGYDFQIRRILQSSGFYENVVCLFTTDKDEDVKRIVDFLPGIQGRPIYEKLDTKTVLIQRGQKAVASAKQRAPLAVGLLLAGTIAFSAARHVLSDGPETPSFEQILAACSPEQCEQIKAVKATFMRIIEMERTLDEVAQQIKSSQKAKTLQSTQIENMRTLLESVKPEAQLAAISQAKRDFASVFATLPQEIQERDPDIVEAVNSTANDQQVYIAGDIMEQVKGLKQVINTLSPKMPQPVSSVAAADTGQADDFDIVKEVMMPEFEYQEFLDGNVYSLPGGMGKTKTKEIITKLSSNQDTVLLGVNKDKVWAGASVTVENNQSKYSKLDPTTIDLDVVTSYYNLDKTKMHVLTQAAIDKAMNA